MSPQSGTEHRRPHEGPRAHPARSQKRAVLSGIAWTAESIGRDPSKQLSAILPNCFSPSIPSLSNSIFEVKPPQGSLTFRETDNNTNQWTRRRDYTSQLRIKWVDNQQSVLGAPSSYCSNPWARWSICLLKPSFPSFHVCLRQSFREFSIRQVNCFIRGVQN